MCWSFDVTTVLASDSSISAIRETAHAWRCQFASLSPASLSWPPLRRTAIAASGETEAIIGSISRISPAWAATHWRAELPSFSTAKAAINRRSSRGGVFHKPTVRPSRRSQSI